MLTLTAAELVELTGYHQPAKQLAELHRRGFTRAERSPTTGAVILTREHYAAMERLAEQAPGRPRPKLRLA